MDLTTSLVPNSEQINAEDLLVSPVTVTITNVKAGNADQPVFIETAEFPERTYRPAKSMRRLIAAAWGADSAAYIGRKMTLYCDPTVKWGGKPVGGVRISHLSHIEKPFTVSLTVTRGKREPFTVQPLPNAVDADLEALRAAINTAPTLENLQLVWKAVAAAKYTAQLVAAKDARKAELLEAADA